MVLGRAIKIINEQRHKGSGQRIIVTCYVFVNSRHAEHDKDITKSVMSSLPKSAFDPNTVYHFIESAA